ncbi:MAG TPA: tyrosine-type recombinase/integrase [Acidobacteriaceae bacterium]|jgi:integrase|nr:tyrosine-type recombinase/integrase [Acidobacteriaceae bacterium]
MVANRYIGKAVRRKRHLEPKEIRQFLQTIYKSNIRRQFKVALHILLLTLTRKSMLLLASWDEIDFGGGDWTIPKEHVKARKGEEHEHVVYMSKQVAAMFGELKALGGNSHLVLPGRSSPKKPFAQNALNHALEGLTFEMEPFTIHDLRRTASSSSPRPDLAADLYLDHDLGDLSGADGRELTGYDIASWLEQNRGTSRTA